MTLTERPARVVRALHDGVWYPADEVAGGAAYELFADTPGPAFLPNPRPGAQHPYRRFVHRSEVLAVSGAAGIETDGTGTEAPLLMPVSRALDWATLHRMSQRPVEAGSVVEAVRRAATVRRGTRMVKPLTAAQVVGHLRGWLPSGFCYREYDVAHLRTPADLNVLLGEDADTAFALRWRAMDAGDYEIPTVDTYPGLVRMPPHERAGPPVIGSGFAPAQRHLVPEFVTADLADLPLPAGASLVAYTSDGTEVTLYSYLPEQRVWTRMCGPQWRHLLAGVPGGSPPTRSTSRCRQRRAGTSARTVASGSTRSPTRPTTPGSPRRSGPPATRWRRWRGAARTRGGVARSAPWSARSPAGCGCGCAGRTWRA